MTEVPLSQGYVALIDDEDAERVLAFKWTVTSGPSRKNRTRYAYRETGPRVKRRAVLLHRFIMNAPQEMQVDHRDQNGLNCQKSNLRLATSSQNNQNSSKRSDNTSGFKGVYHYKGRGLSKPFTAYVKTPSKRFCLGYFATAEEAARAYDAKAKEMFGEFAYLNFQ